VAVSSVQVARSPNSSDLPDEDIAQSNNYDIYRFGNAQRTAPVRPGQDYDLNGRGSIDPQNPLSGSYKGASAYRNPYIVGLTGVVWRTSVQNALGADGLSIIPDGSDVMPGSGFPVGHHTIFPTVEMSPVDFDQRILNLNWIRVPGRLQ